MFKKFIMFFIETYMKLEHMILKNYIYVLNAAKFLLIIGDVLIRHTTLYSAVPVLDCRSWFWVAETCFGKPRPVCARIHIRRELKFVNG